MLVKHRLLETSYKGAMQARICNMVKAGLLELQFPSSNPPRTAHTGCSAAEGRLHGNFPLCLCDVQVETSFQRAVRLVKGTNGEPKLHENALCYLNVDSLNWNAYFGYETQVSEYPVWLRSLDSSPRTGKPSTWRSETGRLRTRKLRRYA
jgi:hypothetical protein